MLRLIFLGSVSRVTRKATSWGGREEISEGFRLCLSFSKLFVDGKSEFQLNSSIRSLREWFVCLQKRPLIARPSTFFSSKRRKICKCGILPPSAFLLLRQRAFCSKKEKGPLSTPQHEKTFFVGEQTSDGIRRPPV